MITFSKVKENIINKFRTLKVQQYGPKTANVIAPFGDDSAPTKDMIALYAETSNISEPVIIGYINKNQIAQPGEKRIFSTKEDGTVATSIHLFTDGSIELGGNSDNAVRYTPLNSGISAKDSLINAELTKIATAISILGGSYIPSTINTDITGAKIDDIKTL